MARFSSEDIAKITSVQYEFTRAKIAIENTDTTSSMAQIKSFLTQSSLNSKQKEILGAGVQNARLNLEKIHATALNQIKKANDIKQKAIQLSKDYNRFNPFDDRLPAENALKQLQSYQTDIKDLQIEITRIANEELPKTILEAQTALLSFQTELRGKLSHEVTTIQTSIASDSKKITDEHLRLIDKAKAERVKSERRPEPNPDYSTFNDIVAVYRSFDDKLGLIEKDNERITTYVVAATRIQEDVGQLKEKITAVCTPEQAIALLAAVEEKDKAMQVVNKALGKNTKAANYSAIEIIENKFKELEHLARITQMVNQPIAYGRMISLIHRIRLQEAKYPSEDMRLLVDFILMGIKGDNEYAEFENLRDFLKKEQIIAGQRKIASEYILPQKVWLDSLAAMVDAVLNEASETLAKTELEYFADADYLFAKVASQNIAAGVDFPASAKARLETITRLMKVWEIASLELHNKIDFALQKAFFEKITSAIKIEFQKIKELYENEIEVLEYQFAENSPLARIEILAQNQAALQENIQIAEQEILAMRETVAKLDEHVQANRKKNIQFETVSNNFNQELKAFKDKAHRILPNQNTHEMKHTDYASAINDAESEMEKLVAELNKKKENIANQSNETEIKLAETSRILSKLHENLSQTNPLEEEIIAIQTALAQTSTQFTQAELQLSLKTIQKDQLEKALEGLRNSSSLIKNQKQDSSQAQEFLKVLGEKIRDITEKERALADLEAENKAPHNKVEEEKKAYQSELETLLKEKAELAVNISNYENGLIREAEKINAQKKHMLELVEQTADVESTTLEYYENLAHNLQAEMQELTSTISTLQDKKLELYRKLEEKEHKLATLTAHSTQEGIDEFTKAEKELQDKFAELTNNQAKVNDEITEATFSLEKIVALKTQYNKVVAESLYLENLKQSLAEISTQEAELEQIKHALTVREEQLSEEKRRLAEVESEIKVLKANPNDEAENSLEIKKALRITNSVYAQLLAIEGIEPAAINKPVASSYQEDMEIEKAVEENLSNVLEEVGKAAKTTFKFSFFKNGKEEIKGLQQAISELATPVSS